jgi:hypothetical protein
MNITDLGVAVVAGVVGFGVIWGLFSLIRQQRAAPVEMLEPEPKAPAESRARLSLAELGSSWHVILGVSAQASPDEIEAGYHARLAECDRIRFAANESAAARQDAETRRAQVCDAYEFIRQARH